MSKNNDIICLQRMYTARTLKYRGIMHGLSRAPMCGRALRKMCAARYENSLDIFNIKKIWGVLVMANFGYKWRQGRALLGAFLGARPYVSEKGVTYMED